MLSFILTSCQKEEIVVNEMTQIETTTSQSGKQQLQMVPPVGADYEVGCCYQSIYTVQSPNWYTGSGQVAFQLVIDGVVEEVNTIGDFNFSEVFNSSGTHSFRIDAINLNSGNVVAGGISYSVTHYNGSLNFCWC